jgi:ABC-type multidrug transport system ATPase subunit
VLCAQDLSFEYPGRPLFAAQSWRVPSGVTWVHGGEGCGKTTLLRLLAGALPLRAGQLQINGVSLADQPVAYRQQVFWADPKSEAFEQVTPHDYLASLRGRYPRFDDALSLVLTEGLALTPHLHKPLYMLSTGSKRKVWLAAALASGAPVTLLDEPFAALDLASVRFVLRWLTEAAQHPARAWLVADYAAPAGVPLASVIDLGKGAL